ncbi:MAG: chemotaxis protein, partial [Arcobacteraceae bacterium]|nr:chemotaxis protein [Arcobacteraceae bacterium]
MFKNLSTRTKLLSFPVLIILVMLILGSVFSYYNSLVNSRVAAASQTDVFIQQVLKGRISVYQFLRVPSTQKADKVREDFKMLDTQVSTLKPHLSLKENRDICDEILSLSQSYIKSFDDFSQPRIEDFNNGIIKESQELLKVLNPMVKTGLTLEKKLVYINKSAIELKNDAQNELTNVLLIISVIIVIIFIIISIIISSIIVNSIKEFNFGLNSFFSYLNRETKDTDLLNDSSKDEFGQMAKVVNENIIKTKKGVEEDRQVISDTIEVLNEFEQGDLCKRVNTQSSNPALQELTRLLNQMATNIELNIDNVLSVLEQYSNSNYMNRVKTDGIKEHLLKLATGVNTLGDAITTMLIENKSNGLTLDNSSNILLKNVDILNQNSNEAAAALEETAAAL